MTFPILLRPDEVTVRYEREYDQVSVGKAGRTNDPEARGREAEIHKMECRPSVREGVQCSVSPNRILG